MIFSDLYMAHFMKMAFDAIRLSKDKTRVGCVIVGKDKNVISTGFNGFPKGVIENEVRKLPQYKLRYMCHAEQNALDLAESSVKGASLFTTHHPCADCARSIIQKGIKSVFYWFIMDNDRWRESNSASANMLKEAGVNLVCLYTQESSYVAEETLGIETFYDPILTLKKTVFPKTHYSLTGKPAEPIHSVTIGPMIMDTRPNAIPLSGKTWTIPMQSLQQTVGASLITKMQDSFAMVKCFPKVSLT